MIHANVDIVGAAQLVDRVVKDFELGLRRRYGRVLDHALPFETCGQVRVVVNRQAVGTHLQHLVECAIKCFHILVRQPVNQVKRNRLELILSRVFHQADNIVCRLNPLYGSLYLLITFLPAVPPAMNAVTGLLTSD